RSPAMNRLTRPLCSQLSTMYDMKSRTFTGTNPMPLAFALLVTPITIRSVQAQTFTVLHRFTGARSGDGTLPEAGLVRDAAGNLYGTTQYGGTGWPIFVAPLQLVAFGCRVVLSV